MESSITLFRIRGIPIGAHWSWLLVVALVVWSLATELFPSTYPGLGDGTYLAMGVATALLFFAAIVAHELGHAFVALSEGMHIEGISLWLFGGVAAFRGRFPSPGAEFRIAIAGPAVSLAAALLFWLAAEAGVRLGWPASVAGVAVYLARINAILVAFNLVPALPLDGGRVLRALLWHRQRSFGAATATAARAGRAFGVVLAVVGLLNYFTGGTNEGLWLVLLGWFLVQAAQSEAAMAVVQQALSTRRISDLMSPNVAVTPPDVDVATFLETALGGRAYSSYPVVGGERVLGLMQLKRAGAVEFENRRTTHVRDVMLPIGDVPVVAPETVMTDAFDLLQREPGRALVMDRGRLVGIVSVTDVARTLELERAAGFRPEPQARRAGVVVWTTVIVAMVAAAAALYHPPYVVLEPGPSFDVVADIEITNAPSDRPTGSYLLTSVRVARHSGLGLLAATLTGDGEIVSLSDIAPPDADLEEVARRQQEMFRQSQFLAAAAAAGAVGMDVRVEGSGARVDDVLAGSPAAQSLRPGDVIVAVDGRPVDIAPEVQREIASRPPGTRFVMAVERGGVRRRVTVVSAELAAVSEEAAAIGVFLSTRDLSVDLPFDVRFARRAIGGSSAGLAYALAIADMLDDEDYARGRDIAATGTIDFGGNIGPVGGVGAKSIAARAAGADVLLVPARQIEEATGDDLHVRGVATLREALRILETGTASGAGSHRLVPA